MLAEMIVSKLFPSKRRAIREANDFFVKSRAFFDWNDTVLAVDRVTSVGIVLAPLAIGLMAWGFKWF